MSESMSFHDRMHTALVYFGLAEERVDRYDAGGYAEPAAADAYADPYGACWDRAIHTAGGALIGVDDGASCPNGNSLSWFDAFYNAASSNFGATVQILP